jgi:hypothetical protein
MRSIGISHAVDGVQDGPRDLNTLAGEPWRSGSRSVRRSTSTRGLRLRWPPLGEILRFNFGGQRAKGAFRRGVRRRSVHKPE